MALPSSVQAQVENAERLQALIAGEQAAAEGAAPTDAGTGESPAAQTPPAAPAQEPEPAAQTAQPTQPNPEDDPNSETWKSRFRTLQGMFNSEVPKLQRANADLERNFRELKEAFDATKAQPPAQPLAATGTPLVTQADVETFGQDLVDLMRRVAKDTFAGGSQVLETVNKLKADVAALQGSVGSVSERVVVSDRERFLQALEKLVPDWKAVDSQQPWLDWLGQYDPLIGDTRQNALVQATNVMNPERVAAFFDAYKATFAPPAPANGAQRMTASREQQRQVAPPRNRSAAPIQSPDTKVWTGREIGQFYDEVRRGVHAPEFAAAIEAQINAAMEAGRIAP
jgi:hypothetical protein